MLNRKRIHLRYCVKNPHAVLLKYKKIFVYHYRYIRWQHTDPLPDHNLRQIGCTYVGWFDAGFEGIGEIWKYPTKRHKILIEMSVTADHLLWHKDWVNKVKKLKKENDQLDQYVKKLIRKTKLASRYIP